MKEHSMSSAGRPAAELGHVRCHRKWSRWVRKKVTEMGWVLRFPQGAPMSLRDTSRDENRGALRRVLCRERRRRQPPKVSGSLAAPHPNGDFPARVARRRGQPSRVPFGSERSPLTGPGAAAGQKQADRRKGQPLARCEVGADTAEMDPEACDQYLKDLREEYVRAGKKEQKRLLDQARKRSIVGAHPNGFPAALGRRPQVWPWTR